MTIKQSDIIYRLKSQPRQGASSPQDPGSSGAQAAKNFWDEMVKVAKNQGEVVANLSINLFNGAAAYNKLTQSAYNAAAGLKTASNLTKEYGDAILVSIKNATRLEEKNTALNKSFGIGVSAAADLGDKIDNLGESYGVGTKKLREYVTSLNDVTAGQIANNNTTIGLTKLNFKMLTANQTMLQNRMGLEAEQAAKYELYASTVLDTGGKSIKNSTQLINLQAEFAKKIEDATGLQGVHKTMTSEILKLTEDVQLQYSRIPGNLELAVLKSRALGISMAELNAAGKSMLNIESSIGSELEYQLLTGKRLVGEADAKNDLAGKSLTNAYREATLKGDGVKQAEIMNQIIKQEGDNLQNNMIARQKMAEMLGTDEATLARMIQKQKLMARLGVEEIMELNKGDMDAAIKAMQDRGVSDSDIQKVLKLSDTRSTAERSADTLEQIYRVLERGSGEQIKKLSSQVTKDFDGPPGTQDLTDMLSMYGEGLKIQKTAIGTLQQQAITMDEMLDATNKLIQVVPAFGKKIAGATDWLGDLITTAKTLGVSADAQQNDAIMVNDGVIQFHRNDKFMKVADGMSIAGTDAGGNTDLAEALRAVLAMAGAGGSSSTTSENQMQQFAQVIANAIKNVKLEIKDNSYGPRRL